MTEETFPPVGSDAPYSHPGAMLAEELEYRRLSQRAAAHGMGLSFEVVNGIVRGLRSVDAETALQLEATFGTPAYLWLVIQTDYDLYVAREKMEQAKLAS